MTRRILPFLFLAVSLCIPISAQAQRVSAESQWDWHPLVMRTTSAASVVQEFNWAKGEHGLGSTRGFADSIVIRKAAATETLVDTSAAYKIGDFFFPPTFAARSGSAMARAAKFNGGAVTAQFGGVDSVIVDSTDSNPWIAFRVVQDTLSQDFAATSGLDSILVGAQISYDGINWLAVNGTPTRAFLANATGISGTDGIAIPMITATEPSPGADVVELVVECQPAIHKVGNSFIINRTLCAAGAYVRFIIGLCDGSGQFKPEIGYWSK